ncbi:unnamed protein product [Symbiodinium sp. CCMP2592]|nr:unnamed protein product [Symbiodinium sp. CCMP2592]
MRPGPLPDLESSTEVTRPLSGCLSSRRPSQTTLHLEMPLGGAGFIRLQSPDAFDEVLESGNYRSISAQQLLSGHGSIFDDTLFSLFAASGSPARRFPTREEVQMAGDSLFQKSREAGHVDFFISHSWKAERWSKFLALCMFFNLTLAIKCSFAMWCAAAVALIASTGWTSLGGSYFNFPCLVCLPMATFFIMFFWGQQISAGLWSPTVWLDRFCIHQTDLERKQQQIVSLPVFVARSSRMLLLWDDTYFDRLWCHLELATFACYGGAEKVDVVPLWLAPWLLASILSHLLSVTFLELLEHAFPSWSAQWLPGILSVLESHFGDNQALQKFAAMWVIGMTSSIIALPVSIPSFFAFRLKLHSHQLMLSQMASFDVRAASCTVPADRSAVEQQVQQLFRSDSGSRHQLLDEGEVHLQRFLAPWDPLDGFNTYVRGTLREAVIAQIGNELEVPWHTCMTAILPMILYSSVNILGCDNGSCEESARVSGYSSVFQYMEVQVVAWALSLVTCYVLIFPVLLRMVKFVVSCGSGSYPLQCVLAGIWCPLAFEYCYFCVSLTWGSIVSLVQNYSRVQLIISLAIMTGLVAQVIFLFCGYTMPRRQHVSCRCVTREATGPG